MQDVIQRAERQPILDVLANIGGTAGLTTGMSVITCCEIIYFIGNWCLHVRTQLRNRAVEHIQAGGDYTQ